MRAGLSSSISVSKAFLASLSLAAAGIDLTTCRPTTSTASSSSSSRTLPDLQRRAVAYVDPTTNGGSMLTQTDTATGVLGEPLNVIISGESDAQVLTPEGIEEYLESLFFSPGDCVGISLGGPQQANLGDGNGSVNQTDVFRFNYYSGDSGTCLESLHGGNHLRYWSQNGSAANTGAVFMAVSYEYNASLAHAIVPDGYDLGRNLLVGNATNATGTTSPGGFQYTTTNTTAPLLSSFSASQINHNIAVDGNVAILTVRVTKTGTLGANRDVNPSSSSSSSPSSSSSSASGSASTSSPTSSSSSAGRLQYGLAVSAATLLWTGVMMLL